MFYSPLKHSSGHKDWLRRSPGSFTGARFEVKVEVNNSPLPLCFKHALSKKSRSQRLLLAQLHSERKATSW